MKESLNEENVKIIENKNESSNFILSSKEKSLKHYYSLNKYGKIGKYTSSLKLRLVKGIIFLDSHIKLFSFLKFIFGFIFLVIPWILIVYIVYMDNTVKNDFIFFPFFVSVSLIISSLLIFLVMKLAESCKMSGILIHSYERIYNFKIFKIIVAGSFLLWILFTCEDFVSDFNLLKEKVAQSKEEEINSKRFNEGTYIIRLLFIFLFWDLEKNNKKEFIYNNIGYFEYEDSFFEDFHLAFRKIFIPIITFCFGGILKIFLVKTKRGILYLILYSVSIFISFYLYFDNSIKQHSEKKIEEENKEYFKESDYKYFEIVPISIIVLILIVLNTKFCVIDLTHQKYYSYNDKTRNNFVVFLVIFSYILNSLGYLFFLFILYNLFFRKIDNSFSIESFSQYWIMIYTSILLIFVGYSFPFGHYFFKLIYHSTAFEWFPHLKKNGFYIMYSDNMEKDSGFYLKEK